MKNKLTSLIWIILVVFLIQSCKKDPEPSNGIPEDVLKTNDWIFENMSLYYFWNNFLPQVDRTAEPDPAKYFEKLLYQEDQWSYITDDYKTLEGDLSGEPTTMGYHPKFYRVSQNSNDIMIVVSYVYPGSPADLAGLKRGDIILKINNKALTTQNYYQEYSGTNYSVQTATIQGGTLVPTGVSLNMTAKIVQADPAIHHEVIDVNGHKIAYLVYVGFTSGDQNKYLTSLNTIFSDFKAQGITDLVVDLRYNPGGDINAAAHLASLIAPASAAANSEVLIRMRYNSELQAYLESNPQYAGNVVTKFKPVPANLNMSTVAFLTTDRTASASELVIVGLEPYMNVIQIGEPTYGKYTGSWVIPDNESAALAKWAMMPIVLKYENKAGKTDFVNGLTPDVALDDEVIGYGQFGDFTDPLLAQAVLSLTGQAAPGTKSARSVSLPGLEQVIPAEKELMNNLFVPVPEFLKK